MRRFTIIFFLVLGVIAFAQYPEGTIKIDSVYSKALNNTSGNNTTRSLHIYLPPNYDNSIGSYPVIYHLHGFGGTDSGQIKDNRYHKLLDKAIGSGRIRPVIVVFPNQYTLFRGSYYTNSSLTGNWEDFTAIDLVNHIDANYRTISDSESRGITGHSMGGYGAIKVAMKHPDVFSTVYSLSGALGLYEELGNKGQVYKKLAKVDSIEKLVTGYDYFLENVIVAMGRAFSPNLESPPFYADLPYAYEADSLVVNSRTIELWESHFLHNMANDYVENLEKLSAIKIDWGRNDDFDFVKQSCIAFTKELERIGVQHFAEEYLGTHFNKLWTADGRVLTDVLPFFNTYLEFEQP